MLPPWKGGILPLNYECTRHNNNTLEVFPPISTEHTFYTFKRTYWAGQPPPPLPPPGATGPAEDTQLSPLVIPSQVRPAAIARWHNSLFFAVGSVLLVANEK